MDKTQGGPCDLARRASPQIDQAFSKDGDEGLEYKATAALFGRTPPLYKKAIANFAERAHGWPMSHYARFPLLQIHAGSRS
jgi:hypothetical protein